MASRLLTFRSLRTIPLLHTSHQGIFETDAMNDSRLPYSLSWKSLLVVTLLAAFAESAILVPSVFLPSTGLAAALSWDPATQGYPTPETPGDRGGRRARGRGFGSGVDRATQGLGAGDLHDAAVPSL